MTIDEPDAEKKIMSPFDDPCAIISYPLLTGSNNYDEWASAFKTALSSRKKFRFLDGTITQPKENTSEYEVWFQLNSLIVSWIKMTIHESLRSSITHRPIARDLWENLKQRFFVSNGPKFHQLKMELGVCKQQGSSIESYFGRLSKIWDAMLMIRPIRSCKCGKCDCKINEQLEKDHEEDKVHQFLLGLDDCFRVTRFILLARVPLPSLEDVYNLIRQEEDMVGLDCQTPPLSFTRERDSHQWQPSPPIPSDHLTGTDELTDMTRKLDLVDHVATLEETLVQLDHVCTHCTGTGHSGTPKILDNLRVGSASEIIDGLAGISEDQSSSIPPIPSDELTGTTLTDEQTDMTAKLDLVDHVATLEETLGKLEGRRDELLNRIKVQKDLESKRLNLFAEVEQWLSEVELTVCNANALVLEKDDEIDEWESYGYIKRVEKVTKEVESLMCRGVFDEVFQEVIIPKVKERLLREEIIGQEELFESTWNSLMEEGVGILGIYGISGIGKTTLLTQINNKFLTVSNDFDIVIWVVLSRNETVKSIQEKIGKRLELENEGWEEKTENEIALMIKRSLENKKYVLLLDNMKEKVDLASIGIPVVYKNGSKIAFTTRLNDVCESMKVDKEIEVTCLNEVDAWNLFKSHWSMKSKLENHPDMSEVAESFAKMCQGIPLVLIVHSITISRIHFENWSYTLEVLSSSPSSSGEDKEVLSILKLTYNELYGYGVGSYWLADLHCKPMKPCFLYCASFPEDYVMRKDELVEYWVGKDSNDIYDREDGYAIIEYLVSAYLLEEDSESKELVKMPDLLRQMGLWVSSGGGKQKSKPKSKEKDVATKKSMRGRRRRT